MSSLESFCCLMTTACVGGVGGPALAPAAREAAALCALAGGWGLGGAASTENAEYSGRRFGSATKNSPSVAPLALCLGGVARAELARRV